MTQTNLDTEAAARRAAAEQIIARYPDVEPDELAHVLRYFRRDATALDRAMIASNPDLEPRYRKLCRDHGMEGLRPLEIALVALGVSLLVLMVYVMSALAGTL